MRKFLIVLVALGVVSCGAGQVVKKGDTHKKESTPQPIKLRRQDREDIQFMKLQRDVWNNALLVKQGELVNRYGITADQLWDVDFEGGRLVYIGPAPTAVPSPVAVPQGK